MVNKFFNFLVNKLPSELTPRHDVDGKIVVVLHAKVNTAF
jgi:hypothetical protein